jgi:hypothetical protein
VARRPVERTEIHADTDREKRPQQQSHRCGHDPFEQPHGDAEQQHPNTAFTLFHPGACARQQVRTTRTDQQQWHTHTQSQREQRAAAEQRISGGTEIDQRARERRRETRGHDEARQTTHHRDTRHGTPPR